MDVLNTISEQGTNAGVAGLSGLIGGYLTTWLKSLVESAKAKRAEKDYASMEKQATLMVEFVSENIKTLSRSESQLLRANFIAAMTVGD